MCYFQYHHRSAVFHGPGALVIFPAGPDFIGESRSDAGSYASSVSSEAAGWAVKGPLPGSRGKRLVEIQILAGSKKTIIKHRLTSSH